MPEASDAEVGAERPRRPAHEWDGDDVGPGESRDLVVKVGESYSGGTVEIPVHVRRGASPGPVLLVTAALHGDELNGTGAIRSLIRDENFEPERGSVVFVPVLNLPGFDRHSRYLPDRRDLNRCFPGSAEGSLARRMAHSIFDELVTRADFIIDLHTAAVRRTNYPTLRADLSDPEVRRLADAFAPELILSGRGPKGSFRRAACESGCPTVVFEAGEVWKVEPSVVEATIRGIRNAMSALGMLAGREAGDRTGVVIEKTKWVRAERGGILEFHAVPGQIVDRDQALATNTSLLGRVQNVLRAPFGGVVLGMTTLPAVSPGEAVYHIGRSRKGSSTHDELSGSRVGLRRRLVGDLASSVLVTDPPPESDTDGTRS